MKIRIKGDLRTEQQLKADEARVDSGILGPFIWNTPQKIVWLWMCRQIAAGVPVRIIILKARQFGISTFFCCWLFWWMWRKMAIRAMIAAQTKGITLNAMAETMDRFYQSLPDGFRPTLRAKGAERTSKDELYFEERKCGLLYVAADTKHAGRGDSYDLALCTEVSSYRTPEEFFGAFRPAMGRRADTTLVMESTAQPGWYWEEYKKGKKRDQSIFLPWSAYPELYRRRLIRGTRGNQKVLRDAETQELVTFTREDRKEMAFLSRQHERMNEIIGHQLLKPVDEEQMWWWHYVCEDEYGGDTEWMNQEYPRDDISAFEKSIRGVFKSVLPMVRATVEEVQTDDAFNDGGLFLLRCDTLEDTERESHQIELLEDDDIDQAENPGALILKMPVPGYIYTVGVDVADELGTAADEDDAAFSVISVYCCNTREQVAEWRGSIDPHDLGDQVAMMGYLYNTALVNVEYNNMGITTIDRLTKYLDYPNRFRWPKFDEAFKYTKKEMWWTDEKTKQLMIGSLRHAIRNDLFRVRSPGLQEELTAYQVKKGHMSAGPQSYADRIMAAALAWQGVEQTDYGMREVLGGRADADEGDTPARVVVTQKSPGLPPPRELPAALAAEIGESQFVEDDDYFKIDRAFLVP